MKEQDFLDLTGDLDVESFWHENDLCDLFTPVKPRCALSFSPDDHWLFEFLDVSSTVRYYHDKDYRDSLHREANAITGKQVWRTFFEEDTWVHSPKRIENLFGSEFRYEEHGTPWLQPATNDPEEFARILDRAEATDLREWALPGPYLEEWERRRLEGKPLSRLGTGSRGPATIMTSVLTAEDVFFWMEDHPALMKRFSEVLTAKMIELNRVLRQFSGNEQTGWWITDDNCALFNRELYREYCYPVLQSVLDTFAPGDAARYQHSDSSMEHLLDYQYALGIRSVNYGPGIDVRNIRLKMPDAIINGHLPPFLLRNAGPGEIEQRIISDFEKAGEGGGLNVTTAGSLAAGTGVGRMRWLMHCVQKHCRYDSPNAPALA